MSDRTGVATEVQVFRFLRLWQKLSDMTGGLTDTGRGLYEFNFIVQSVIVVQVFYGICALYLDLQKHQNWRQIDQSYNIYFPTAAWSIVNLVVLCEAAHSVTDQVSGSNFIDHNRVVGNFFF